MKFKFKSLIINLSYPLILIYNLRIIIRDNITSNLILII